MIKRILFSLCILFSLTTCEAQNYYQPSVLFGGQDGYFDFAMLGHSIADGAATAGPHTLPVGTLKMWTKGAVRTTVDVTTQSIANDSPTLGSLGQYLAEQYKTEFGIPSRVVNVSRGGSTWSAAHTFPWDPDDGSSLYPAAKSRIDSAMADWRIRKLDAIIIYLGINDCKPSIATPIANILDGITDVLTSLQTDYPGVPILLMNVGAGESIVQNLLYRQTRQGIVNAAVGFADVHLVGDDLPFYLYDATLGTTNYYESDGIHLTDDTYSQQARGIVRWFKLRRTGLYHKWTCSILARLWDDLTTTRINAWEAFIQSQVVTTTDNFFQLDELTMHCANHLFDTHVDVTGLGYGVARSATFTANDNLATNGSSTRWETAFAADICVTKGNYNTQGVAMIFLKSYTNVNGARIMGGRSNTSATPEEIGLIGGASNTQYECSDATLSNGGEATFAANEVYGARRAGTTKAIDKNGATFASTTQANTGVLTAFRIYGGCLNNVGTASNFCVTESRGFAASCSPTFDRSSFVSAWKTLISSW